MNTAELKLDLINHSTSINDKARLKELLQQLKFTADESVYSTNEDEKQQFLRQAIKLTVQIFYQMTAFKRNSKNG